MAISTITVIADQAGVITNTADVTSNEDDANPDDNSVTEETVVALCILDLALSFTDGTLTLDFELGTAEPATWGVWWFIPSAGIIPLWSIPLPAIDMPVAFPIPGFPSIGTVGVLTALSPPLGVPCFAFGFVDTGQPSSVGPSMQELRELLPIADGVMPNIGE